MPREKAISSSAAKPSEPEEPVESDEKVDFEEANDPEEAMEEEVEYEEVEEEEEVEEIEEEVEEVEEEEEVEVEEDEEEEEEEEEEVEEVEEDDAMQNHSSDETKVEDEDEKKKHAELLSIPPHGSEVYIGGIPHASDEDLKSLCERIGEVAEVRIMKGKDSSENKGFGFVTFRSVELASKAIEELNNTEFMGKKIKCSKSQAKHRLFIGNVPRSWGVEDLKKIVTEIGPGVTGVELVKDMKNTNNNRGFAFIDYYNHACAEYSRQKMMSPTFKLGENAPTVSWADPKNAESSAASQDGGELKIAAPAEGNTVKAVYVKNLPKNVTQEQLKKLFERHGKITKVVLPPAKSGQEKNRIGFVHFAERSNAMKALKNTERYELEGQLLQCSLAKPQADQKSGGSNTQKPGPGLLPSYPPHVGYGLVGGAYGGLGAGYAAPGLAQPMLYGGGQTPSGMAIMPMLLADGRIGYVLQQPGMQPQAPPSHHRGGRGGGGSGSGNRNVGSSSKGRHNNDGGHGRRYRPY
ncbi:Heterogeneous nuclear ribonucleoprotein Q [Glycine max]|nr:Heterogeneous nuclear ribonucleoprotein Q [Glycine max]